MSEELIKRGLIESGVKITNYEYYDIGETTLEQLKSKKIIPKKDYGKYKSKKPDGLLVNKQNKEIPRVIVCVEYKQPSEFRTDKQKKEATQQCNNLCQVLDAKIGIVTDGQVTFWINPKQKNKENDYIDNTTKIKRSYSFIRNEDKKDLSEPFIISKRPEINYDKLDDETKNTLDYIERILSCVNKKNSTLVSTKEVDPLPLARSVWQDIYINTGKNPEKCLYNVVELFIFKFLSDLGVLESPFDFGYLLNMYKTHDAEGVLDHYARSSRVKIRDLFPPAEEDNTTIINGTIFVDSDGEAVLSQAHLFKNSLKKYGLFPSLKNVKKEFKTKLFETFMKEVKDKSRLGQFLTPRKVVSAIVEMSAVENLPDGSRFCDPFCGVGGFICEPLHNPKRKKDFIPKNGEIKPKIVYHGFDKGSDDEEERTIILAKANMLIYLSGVIEKNPTLTHKFAEVFNEIFHLLTKSNLGTLKKIIEKEEEKYDLILTNPPYITSGVASIREELKNEGLENHYTAGGKGVDGLALEWIIRSLKKGGRAFIVIPDGILNTSQNKSLRRFLAKECFINCIISLPIKTFFNTPKKTYILGITRKHNVGQEQDFPVFTYLVSNVGETLDVNRFETEGKSDLEKAKDLFNSYKGSPKTFPVKEIGDLRCKLQPIKRFAPEEIWGVDKWWSKEDKIKLEIEEEEKTITVEEFKDKLDYLILEIEEYKKVLYEEITNLRVSIKEEYDTTEETLSELFVIEKGLAKYTRDYMRKHKGDYPVYSSQTIDDGIMGKIDTYDYDTECLTWTTDGIHAGTVFYRTGKFSMTTHCGALIPKEEYVGKIDLKYILFQLNAKLKEYATGEGNKRVTVDIIKDVSVKMPVNSEQKYNLLKQKEIAEKYIKIENIKKGLNKKFSEITELNIKITD